LRSIHLIFNFNCMKKLNGLPLGGIGGGSLVLAFVERENQVIAIPFLILGIIACALYYYLKFKNKKNNIPDDTQSHP